VLRLVACLLGRLDADLGPGLGRRLRLLEVLRRLVRLGGEVADLEQLLEDEALSGGLLAEGLRAEPVSHVVVLGARKRVHGAESHVMVGHHQAARRDERRRSAAAAAVVLDRRHPDVVDPFLRGLEAVVGLELGEGQVVERPHALVGRGRALRLAADHGGRRRGLRSRALRREERRREDENDDQQTLDRGRHHLSALFLRTVSSTRRPGSSQSLRAAKSPES
jgi:hypothetical protein